MNDEEFLRNLEECSLPESEFHHAAHVRAGYLYLRQHSFPDAIGRMCSSIRAYATALGKPARYHETITIGFLSLIHMRMRERGDAGGWEAFERLNPELLSKDALFEFYPRELPQLAPIFSSLPAPETWTVAMRPQSAGDYRKPTRSGRRPS